MRRERRMSIFTACVGVRAGLLFNFPLGSYVGGTPGALWSSLARGQLVTNVAGLGLERQSVKVSSNCARNAVR